MLWLWRFFLERGTLIDHHQNILTRTTICNCPISANPLLVLYLFDGETSGMLDACSEFNDIQPTNKHEPHLVKTSTNVVVGRHTAIQRISCSRLNVHCLPLHPLRIAKYFQELNCHHGQSCVWKGVSNKPFKLVNRHLSALRGDMPKRMYVAILSRLPNNTTYLHFSRKPKIVQEETTW